MRAECQCHTVPLSPIQPAAFSFLSWHRGAGDERCSAGLRRRGTHSPWLCSRLEESVHLSPLSAMPAVGVSSVLLIELGKLLSVSSESFRHESMLNFTTCFFSVRLCDFFFLSLLELWIILTDLKIIEQDLCPWVKRLLYVAYDSFHML